VFELANVITKQVVRLESQLSQLCNEMFHAQLCCNVKYFARFFLGNSKPPLRQHIKVNLCQYLPDTETG